MSFKNSSIKLIYFNARGVIENARIMLAIGNVQYEDYRYPIDTATFARPEFDADKAAGLFGVNMDRLPLLEVNGQQIGQSKSIEKYIAKSIGLFGSNDVEGALIDMITEHIRDIKQGYTDAKAGKKDAELENAKTEFITTKLPDWMTKLEKCLSGNGYAIGSSLSLADVTIYSFVCDYFDDKEGALKSVASCPKLINSCEKVKAAAANWLSTRPDTKF